jgi:hypothetical protein
MKCTQVAGDEVEARVLRRLVRGARECAEDVIADADARYPEDQRNEQPTSARRHMRDTATALATLDLVSRFETDII